LHWFQCAVIQSLPSPFNQTHSLSTSHGLAGKEEWDVVISSLFKFQSSKDEPFRIREAWSFDRQNHGDAAVLNSHALFERKDVVSEFPTEALPCLTM
jgi:hypothetical protein